MKWAFVRLRETLATNKDLARKLAELGKRIASHDESIQLLLKAIRELMNEPVTPRKKIGFHLKERHSPFFFSE